jgi:uncharacterized membrane protein
LNSRVTASQKAEFVRGMRVASFYHFRNKAFRRSQKRMSWGHLHLLLNHVPVIGTLLGLLLLLLAFVRKSEELKKVTLGLFVLIALVTIPVYLTGEPAEEMVEDISGVSKAMIDRHEDAALFSLIAVEVAGIIALAGLLLFRTKKGLGNLLAIVTLACSVVTAGLLAWTSNLGGQVRHTEISSGVGAESQTETDKSGRRKDSEEEREDH